MKFQELSSDVQARIINDECQFLWETEWYEGTFDYIREIADVVGIYIEKDDFSFDLDRRSFGFSGEIAYRKGWKQDAIKNFGADVFSSKRRDEIANFMFHWKQFCENIQRKHFYGLHGVVNLGYDLDDDSRISSVYWDKPDTDLEMDDLKQDFEEILEDFKHMALRLLESEIEYLTSEDRFIEQGLEYDEDGNEIIDMVA